MRASQNGSEWAAGGSAPQGAVRHAGVPVPARSHWGRALVALGARSGSKVARVSLSAVSTDAHQHVVHRAVEWEAHPLGAAHAAVLHLLPHEVAVAEHPRQDEHSVRRLGNPKQRAQQHCAMARLRQMLLHGDTRVDGRAQALIR